MSELDREMQLLRQNIVAVKLALDHFRSREILLLETNIKTVNEHLSKLAATSTQAPCSPTVTHAVTHETEDVEGVRKRGKADKSRNKVSFGSGDDSSLNTQQKENAFASFHTNMAIPPADEGLEGYLMILKARRAWLLDQDLEADVKLRNEWLWLIQELDINTRKLLDVNEHGVRHKASDLPRQRARTMSCVSDDSRLSQFSRDRDRGWRERERDRVIQSTSRERGASFSLSNWLKEEDPIMTTSKPADDHMRLRSLTLSPLQHSRRNNAQEMGTMG